LDLSRGDLMKIYIKININYIFTKSLLFYCAEGRGFWLETFNEKRYFRLSTKKHKKFLKI